MQRVILTSTVFSVVLVLVGHADGRLRAGAETISRPELGRREAVRLATVAFDSKFAGRRHPIYSFEPYTTESDARFLSYEAYGNWNPKRSEGSVILGHIAVNKFTTQVWDRDNCKKIEGPMLRQLQVQYRRQLRITPKNLAATPSLTAKPNDC